MKDLHLTKKDFRLEWFSGQGAGGQHRNKHQNCCRITHLETGLRAQGTESRDRVSNQRAAFTRLAKLVISYYSSDEPTRRKWDKTKTPQIHSGQRNQGYPPPVNAHIINSITFTTAQEPKLP